VRFNSAKVWGNTSTVERRVSTPESLQAELPPSSLIGQRRVS
jgi:hypothetical protein